VKKVEIVALILLGIGIVFRVYQFGIIPLALNRDEAALGYNAFTIATSGMDEWGNHLPTTFRSFGDYKLPGYIYTLSFLIHVFGVHDWVIRLPSLIACFGIILITFWLILRISKQKTTALLAATMVAIQPWDIFYGRMAYEAHLGLCLLLTSIYLWQKTKPFAWAVGTLCLMAAVLTYNTPLLLIPVMLASIVVMPDMPRKQKWVVGIGMILVGLFGFSLLQSVTVQKQSITIFSDPTIIDAQAKAYTASHTIFEKVWNHREIYWGRLATSRFFQSWSPHFLTIRGGQNPWHSVPGGAHLYWSTYGLVLVGLMYLTISKRLSLGRKVALWILILGSLAPAIVTIDAPHATRSLFFFWIITVIAGIGWAQLPVKLRVWIPVFLTLELGVFGWRYFNQFPQYRSTAWPIGLRQSLQQTKGMMITIDAHNADVVADQVYIYPLLYWQTPVSLFTTTALRAPLDAAHMNRVIGFENFSTSRYNQEVGNGRIIERHTDGSYTLKP